MLLVLTNSGDVTADYLLSRLTSASVQYVRLDTDRVLEQSAVSYSPGNPNIRIGDRWFTANDFSSVWYRRPERLVCSRIPDTPEGKCALDEWAESFEGVFAHIPRHRWMNYPATNALASRKLEQLSTAKRLGFVIPDTIVTQDPMALRVFFQKHNERIIVKPMGRAYIEGPDCAADSVIFTNLVDKCHLDDLEDLTRCPTLFQQAVPKQSDVRITVVDGDIHAIELIAMDTDGKQRCDIRRNNMVDVSYRLVDLPHHISIAVKKLVEFYELRFAAIDMAIADDGLWYFFEVNPNGQWAWLDLSGGAAIYKSFIASFQGAQEDSKIREHGITILS